MYTYVVTLKYSPKVDILNGECGVVKTNGRSKKFCSQPD